MILALFRTGHSHHEHTGKRPHQSQLQLQRIYERANQLVAATKNSTNDLNNLLLGVEVICGDNASRRATTALVAAERENRAKKVVEGSRGLRGKVYTKQCSVTTFFTFF